MTNDELLEKIKLSMIDYYSGAQKEFIILSRFTASQN